MKKNPPKKPAESWRVIDVPVWDCRVLVYCGPFDGFVARIKEGGIKDTARIEEDKPGPYRVASTFSHKSGDQFIYSQEPMKQDVLVHELCHAAFGIMRSRSCDDEEAHAYLMEYLFKEATK